MNCANHQIKFLATKIRYMVSSDNSNSYKQTSKLLAGMCPPTKLKPTINTIYM